MCCIHRTKFTPSSSKLHPSIADMSSAVFASLLSTANDDNAEPLIAKTPDIEPATENPDLWVHILNGLNSSWKVDLTNLVCPIPDQKSFTTRLQ